MARAEQENVPQPIPELPKGEVIFSRQLTLRELLQIKPGEEGETEDLLNDVPFNFELRDVGKSFLHIVSFSKDKPVSLWELFPLLKAAKPGGVSRAGQDTGGILADWRIILPEVREKEPASRELYDFHKEHVPGFSEFEENHFELFWKVLEFEKRGGEEIQFVNQQLGQFIDEREFFARYGSQHVFSNGVDIEFFALIHGESLRSFLEEKGFKIPPNPDPEGFPEPEVQELLWSMSKEEQKALEIEFYRKLVNERGVEVEYEVGNIFRSITVSGLSTTLIGENGELNRIYRGGVLKPLDVVIKKKLPNPNRSIKEPDGFRRLDNGQIELQRGESFIRISFVQGKEGYIKAKLEDRHLSAVEETMVPLIVWQKDKQTEEKSYYCGRYKEFPGQDTLLGQLVVAAYSPKVRDQMPLEIKMIGIDGQEKTQQMLEAQTVLLVPGFANQFLMQSPVILGLEALATQGVPLQS